MVAVLVLYNASDALYVVNRCHVNEGLSIAKVGSVRDQKTYLVIGEVREVQQQEPSRWGFSCRSRKDDVDPVVGTGALWFKEE